MFKHEPASLPFRPATPWGLLRFETPEAAAPAAAPETPAADPEAGAAAPVEPSAAATPPAATPAWGPDTPEFGIAVDQAVRAHLAQFAGGQEAAEPQPPAIQLDPFAEDFGQQLVGTLGQLLEQTLDQRLGPIQQTFDQQQIEQGKADSFKTFETFGDLGEFDHDRAFRAAQDIFTGYLNTYGPRYAEQFTGRALREAAEQQAQYERTIETRAVERYKQQLAGLSERPSGDLGVGGGASRAPEQASSYDEVIARHAARRQAAGVQL